MLGVGGIVGPGQHRAIQVIPPVATLAAVGLADAEDPRREQISAVRPGGHGGLALEYSERRPHSAFLQGRAATVAARMGGAEPTVLGVRTRCGALKPDARGRTLRGDLAALERLLAAATALATPLARPALAPPVTSATTPAAGAAAARR
jgi:hypothetical protein